MRKYNISFIINNLSPGIFPNQVYNTNCGIAAKLSSGDYKHYDDVKTIYREKTATMVGLQTIFVRINMHDR